MESEEVDEFLDWLNYGVSKKWCTDIVCSTHDMVEMTDEENAEWDQGYDPCIFVVRIWN
jgi:hypothetical protein